MTPIQVPVGGFVIDASVWISYVMPEDEHHASSRQWLRRYLGHGGRLVAPVLLAVEVAGGVARRPRRSDLASQIVHHLINLPLMRWEPLSGSLALSAGRLAIDLRLRGADAVYVAVAEKLGLPLVSWDQEHHTRATQRITVYIPGNSSDAVP
jgi:predicted nucleic acid-binding protein